MAIHREACRRVAFDPWIPRGEDLDYLLNIRMYGGGVWFDNKWSVQHLPPTERNEAQRFRQDIYRWIYEHRKLEFSRTQIDLLQIQPHSLDPYPGPFLENSITTRVFVTALLRTIGRAKDRQGYFRAAQVARREAKAYAEMFCSKYFEFQFGWPQVLGTLEADPQIKLLFNEGSCVTGQGQVVGGSFEPDGSPAAAYGSPVPVYGAPVAGGGASVSASGVPVSVSAAAATSAATAAAAAANLSAAPVPVAVPKPDLFDFDLDLEALGIDVDDE
jgi:hypothetical protein